MSDTKPTSSSDGGLRSGSQVADGRNPTASANASSPARIPPDLQEDEGYRTATSSDSDRRLVLHLGWHKTGSTSIQDFLYSHRDALLDRCGILYPSSGLLGDAHFELSNTLQRPDLDMKPWRDVVDELIERQTHWRTAIISSEGLNMADDAQIESILAVLSNPQWRIEVVCWVRLADHYLESLYAELIKSDQIEQSWSTFRDRRLQSTFPNYARRLDPWRVRLAPGAFRLRPYDPQQWPDGDLVSDFFHTIGEPAAIELTEIAKPGWKNATPDLDTLAVLQAIHGHIRQMGIQLPERFLRQTILNGLMHRRLEDSRPRRPVRLLSAAERIELRRREKDWLAARGVQFSAATAKGDQVGGQSFPSFDDLDANWTTHVLLDVIGLLADELAQTGRVVASPSPQPQVERRAA